VGGGCGGGCGGGALPTPPPHHPVLALDLAGIAYADEAGVALLNQLVATGAKVVRISAYVATLLGRVR
jgi:ABC-type transporter Mla MlaB component